MASLPSYQEAVGQPDWLTIVAPYVSILDYASLCLASQRFYAHFAPRLWNDPLVVIRRLGLRAHHDHEWYFKFVARCSRHTRVQTRRLVRIIDFRDFAVESSVFDIGGDERGISATFQHFHQLFPNLRVILIDNHQDYNAALLVRPLNQGFSLQGYVPPLMLSLASCQSQLPSTFFEAPHSQDLVYLDVSGMPGSLRSVLMQGLFGPQNLPALRILKARGREMDDSTASHLLRQFKNQLWSLDLSCNKLTDAIVDHLLEASFAQGSLRSDAFSDVEGKLSSPVRSGTLTYGPFVSVEESEWSASFSHVDRYLGDAPAYSRDAGGGGQLTRTRHSGHISIRKDAADDVKIALAGGVGMIAPDSTALHQMDICQLHAGITHLYVNDNAMTLRGVERLIRLAGGHLEHLECGSPQIDVQDCAIPSWLSKRATMHGVMGLAHLFRPVFSSNLQSLRVHHSLVTQVPSLEMDDLVLLESLWLAERYLFERAEITYPQIFTPDMNPRLTSLTLTNIPRLSTGPIIGSLVYFLNLAALQEDEIREVRKVSARRGPAVLKGLRHIRLEFGPDPSEELADLNDSSGAEDLDPEELVGMATHHFSFFGEAGWRSSASPATSPGGAARGGRTTTGEQQQQQHEIGDRPARNAGAGEGRTSPPIGKAAETSGRLAHPPFSETDEEHLPFVTTWNETEVTVQVWIGSGILGEHRAVNAYMQLLKNPKLRSDVQPAMPYHVIAGVPSGSYVFQAAWEAILAPTVERPARPMKKDLAGMRDVLQAIKEYRAKTKAANNQDRGSLPADSDRLHWSGKLEVVMENTMEHYHSSQYWR